MNHAGVDVGVWPWAHKYVADINNHCVSPWLNWKTPSQVQHGHKPDISGFIQFQFWEKKHCNVNTAHPKPKEACRHFCVEYDHFENKLRFEIWDPRHAKCTPPAQFDLQMQSIMASQICFFFLWNRKIVKKKVSNKKRTPLILLMMTL